MIQNRLTLGLRKLNKIFQFNVVIIHFYGLFSTASTLDGIAFGSFSTARRVC